MKTYRLLAFGMSVALGSVSAIASETTAEPVTVPLAPAGKAQVVFFRPSGYVGSAISCAVSENGAKVSSLPPGRFFIVVADTGKHVYSVSSEAKDEVYFDLKPGQTAYVKCHVEAGFWAGRPKLEATQELEFNSKTWKDVEKARIGPNVLTSDQIKAALASQVSTPVAPLPSATNAVVPAAATSGLSPAAPSSTSALK